MTPGRCQRGERYLIHLGTEGRSLCHLPLRYDEPVGTVPTCRSCLWRVQRDMGLIYLLHFDRPFGHAAHYMGWSSWLDRRLLNHQIGAGANLLRHAKAAGVTWTLAAVWPGTRSDERRMKNHGHARRCPTCRSNLA